MTQKTRDAIMYFAQKEIYNKIKLLGLYKIKTYTTIFLLFKCDNDQILIQSMSGEELVFIGDEFVEDHLEPIADVKLLNILYGLD